MNRYKLSRQAVSDLEEIADYIARDNPQAAIRVIDAVHETLTLLAGNPEMGAARDDLRSNLRVFPARKPAQRYVIAYHPTAHGIEVNSVIHSARDWIGLLGRGPR